MLGWPCDERTGMGKVGGEGGGGGGGGRVRVGRGNCGLKYERTAFRKFMVL